MDERKRAHIFVVDEQVTENHFVHRTTEPRVLCRDMRDDSLPCQPVDQSGDNGKPTGSC
jgi:hypothetical protein